MDDTLQQEQSQLNNSARPQITTEKLNEFVTYIIKNLVTEPDQVEVSVTEDMPGSFTVNVKVGQGDKGRVIGRSGSTINAIRALVRVFGRILVLIQD